MENILLQGSSILDMEAKLADFGLVALVPKTESIQTKPAEAMLTVQ